KVLARNKGARREEVTRGGLDVARRLFAATTFRPFIKKSAHRRGSGDVAGEFGVAGAGGGGGKFLACFRRGIEFEDLLRQVGGGVVLVQTGIGFEIAQADRDDEDAEALRRIS